MNATWWGPQSLCRCCFNDSQSLKTRQTILWRHNGPLYWLFRWAFNDNDRLLAAVRPPQKKRGDWGKQHFVDIRKTDIKLPNNIWFSSGFLHAHTHLLSDSHKDWIILTFVFTPFCSPKFTCLSNMTGSHVCAFSSGECIKGCMAADSRLYVCHYVMDSNVL